MRIAYISYEYPPDISAGGIATYTRQAAMLMKSRGHDVEVFCGSYERNVSELYKNVLTHRVLTNSVGDFGKKVVKTFAERNSERPFDIIESPEINGNGYFIKKAFPEISLTVKLHTPAVFQIRILNTYTPFIIKLRFFIGALRRGRFDLGFWSKYDKNQNSDIDYLICELSEKLSSPSVSLRQWAINFWKISPEKIEVIPYPYVPSNNYSNIPLGTKTRTITFFGKLNVHKGMVNYTQVIKNVLKKHPDYKFVLIGKDGNSHKKGVSMKEFMQKELNLYLKNIEFIDNVPLDDIYKVLEEAEICVFPSIWDNFPLVCLESMSAGRAIVASKEGGMYDMLHSTDSGILVNPKKVNEIVKGINFFIENPEARIKYGQRARQRVLNEYNGENVGEMMEKFYKKLINGEQNK